MASTRRDTTLISADNSKQLMTQLRSIGRRVGPRVGSNRRSKTDKELFCFRRYAATLASNGLWRFPCSVVISESPDFIVISGQHCIGLEVTEATTEAFQRELTELERRPSATKSLDDGWFGDAPERDWCASVISSIAEKAVKLDSYQAAQRHDILVYSNHASDFVRGLGGVHPEDDLLFRMAKEQAPLWKTSPYFGVVSIIDGARLLHDVTGQCREMKLVDLRMAGFGA